MRGGFGNTKPTARRPFDPIRVSPYNVDNALTMGFLLSTIFDLAGGETTGLGPAPYSVVF